MGVAMPCALPPRVVLASTSERRHRLLAGMGIAFEAVDPSIEEDAIAAPGPEATARARAEAKARAVAWARPGAVVVAADTIVALGDDILPKARDAADVERMVRALSGRTHAVVTAVAVAWPDLEAPVVGADVARVTFRPLSGVDISAYVASGEGVGKAGGYAVQGRAGAFIVALEGDVETVVGLPTRLVRALLGACPRG
jgi:septum formation protein